MHFPPDGELEGVEEERKLPTERALLVARTSERAGDLDLKTIASAVPEADAGRADGPLEEMLERLAAGMAPQAPQRGSAAVGEAGEEKEDELVVDQPLEVAAFHPQSPDPVADEVLEAVEEDVAHRRRCRVHEAEDGGDDAPEAAETEGPHLQRRRRTSKRV